MQEKDLIKRITEQFNHLKLSKYGSETIISYNEGDFFPIGKMICSIKAEDGKLDKHSQLDRMGVYRFSFAPSHDTYMRLFGDQPLKPQVGHPVELEYDYDKLDILTPHPLYAYNGWLQILNPSEKHFESIWGFIMESYLRAQGSFRYKMEAATAL